jgi:hypothetical protein
MPCEPWGVKEGKGDKGDVDVEPIRREAQAQLVNWKEAFHQGEAQVQLVN